MQAKDSSSSKQTSYRFTFYHHNHSTSVLPIHLNHNCLNHPQRHLTQTSTQNAHLLAHQPVSPSGTIQYYTLTPQGLQLPKVQSRQSTEDDTDYQDKQSGCSLIDALLKIDEQPKNLGRAALAELNVMQCESFRSSLTLEQEYSDIVSLTEEEKEFFSNFTVANEEGPFSSLKTPRQQVVSVLAERKRVIRNFFRPKGSFLKEDRTCCNSQQNQEDMSDTLGQGSPLSLARQRIRDRGTWTEARLISFNN